jgi:hypothetical protein
MADRRKHKERQPGETDKSPRQPKSAARWFIGNVFSLVRRHGNFAMACLLIGYCVNRASTGVEAFAGRRSLADLKFGLFANVTVVFTISITLSGLSIGLYLRERGNHRRTRERLAARIKELEIKIDPNRTSSKLTSEGLTRRDDI